MSPQPDGKPSDTTDAVDNTVDNTVDSSLVQLPPVPAPQHPWDQWPHEPELQYSWFLVYLSLGTGRSIDKAAHAYKVSELQDLATRAGTDKRLAAQIPNTVSRKASPHWDRAAIRYNWVERAARYDVYALSQLVPQTVTTIFEALAAFAKVTAESLNSGNLKPENWQEVKQAVETLANYISPEILQATIVHAGSVVVPTEPVSNPGDESTDTDE